MTYQDTVRYDQRVTCGVFCRQLYLYNNPGLTSLPPNIFDQNTALTYAALTPIPMGMPCSRGRGKSGRGKK